MKITEPLLRSIATSGMGWNNKQFMILGIYPPKKGWMHRLIGQEISVEKYEALKALKGARLKKGERKKNSKDFKLTGFVEW